MLRRFVIALALAAAAVALPHGSLGAQQDARAFSVYLDCSGVYCDQQFFRTEIVSVNWVRERTAADVHVLVTTQPTGGGGERYSLAFIGQNKFAGVVDTLAYDSPQAATDDETRRALVRTCSSGWSAISPVPVRPNASR